MAATRDDVLLLLVRPSAEMSNPVDVIVSAAGSALAAFGLPLDQGAGSASKTGQLASYTSAFASIYSSKAADLSTLAGIQDSLNA